MGINYKGSDTNEWLILARAARDLPVPDASSGDGIVRTDAQMEEWAIKLGCKIKKPKENELFIDLDTQEQFEVFSRGIHVLRNHGIVKTYLVTTSKSGLPHRHVVVTLYNEHSLIARIALQAALGSDSIRELLSIKRAIDGEENVVVFFEKEEFEDGERANITEGL